MPATPTNMPASTTTAESISLAAVDVGSNAIRFLAVGLGPTGAVVQRDSQRFALRLGSDVFAGGAIGPDAADRCVAVFADIARRLQLLSVQRYRAVATSAMRDATNAAALVGRIHAETGTKLEIISGAEESRLARRALVRAVGSARQGTLLIDLGGGSLELQWAKSAQGRSLPFGCVRLLEAYPAASRPMTPEAAESLCDVIGEQLRRHIRSPRHARGAIGTGGNLTALAGLVPYAGSGVPALSVAGLPALMARAAPMTVAQRVQAFGVREDRADVLLPAMMVLRGLARIYGFDVLVVPDTGLRESILDELAAPPRVRAATRRVLRGLGIDTARGDQLAALAQELFHALAPLHGLWAPALGPLKLAAYLTSFDASDRAAVGAVQRASDALRNFPATLLPARGFAAAVAVAAKQVQASVWTGLVQQRGAWVPEDDRCVDVLSALLRLTAGVVRCGGRPQPSVDLLANAPLIDAGLRLALLDDEVQPLQQALGMLIRVV